MLNFRKELSKVLSSRKKAREAEERNGEAILKEVVIPYFNYVATRAGYTVKTDITFSVDADHENYLEIYVKPNGHQGETIYFNKFKEKDGAMKTLIEIRRIFKQQKVLLDDYPDAIEDGKITAKRFTVFVKTF